MDYWITQSLFNARWQRQCPFFLGKRAYPIITSVSLTEALSHLNADFSVQLIHLGESQNAQQQAIFVRDVALLLNSTPVVLARSECAVQSAWHDVLHCGTTPLGKILFGNCLQGLKRSQINFAPLPKMLLARRSFFTWRNETLLLSECFLPEIQDFV